MKKIFKTLLLLATVTVSTGAIISCGDDDDLAKADALFRPIINADDNIEMGLDQNLSPYMIFTWDNYTDANQYTVMIESAERSIRLTTTDLDISIKAEVECEVLEGGSTTLPVKLLQTDKSNCINKAI